MKKLILIITLLCLTAHAEMLDVDYNFIEHAFDNTRAVSEKDFQKAVQSKTPEPVPDTFKGKLKAFLFGRKYGTTSTQQTPQTEQTDPISEAQIIQEVKNGIYFIKLLAPVIGLNNNVIPAGNYKIKEEKNENGEFLVFYQGREEYGKLRLIRYNDEQKQEKSLTYARVDIVSDEIIRIVYSTIEDTKCAVARVYLQN